MSWMQNGDCWEKQSSPARCLSTFRLRCYNPDCLHEYEFIQDMRVASQSNWICPRCSLNLFGHVDLVTPSDEAIFDMVSNLFTPSPLKKPGSCDGASPFRTAPRPLPVMASTVSPVRLHHWRSVQDMIQNECLSDGSPVQPGGDENKMPAPSSSSKKPSPVHSVISVSSSDSPWKDDAPLFLPPGPYLTIQGLADARRVGEAVFFVTFPRKASYKGRLWVGLVRDSVMGQLGVSRLHAEESDLRGDYRLGLDVEHSNDAVKVRLNLYDRALVSPSFPVYQVRRAGVSVTYRLSSAMIEWFAMYGGEYRGLRCVEDGFEGVFRKWKCALKGGDAQIPLARVMQVLTFLRANPFKTYDRTF